MDELTPEQLDTLGTELDGLARELVTLLEISREGASTVELDQPIGRLSRIDAMQSQKMAQANRDRARLRLAQVHQAQAAMRDGTYGECKRCDDPIGFARLSARPEAPFCRDCQTEIERR